MARSANALRKLNEKSQDLAKKHKTHLRQCLMVSHKIENIKLSKAGKDRVDWARQNMPILQSLKKRFSKTLPFRGQKIGICSSWLDWTFNP